MKATTQRPCIALLPSDPDTYVRPACACLCSRSCSRDRSFLCWDLRNERRITSHVQRMGGINHITLSKDETQVLTVGQEKRISFWDLREHNPTRVVNLTEDLSDEALCVAVRSACSCSPAYWFPTIGISHLCTWSRCVAGLKQWQACCDWWNSTSAQAVGLGHDRVACNWCRTLRRDQ